MYGAWAIVIASAIGSVAWIYQQAWDRQPALVKFILAMRRDASFASVLFPRFFRSQLSASDISDIQMAVRQRE
jgi:hypothetical protein